MQFAHSGYNGLLCLGIVLPPECGIFFRESSQSLDEIVSILPIDWLDRHRNHRLGDVHRFLKKYLFKSEQTTSISYQGCVVSSLEEKSTTK